MDADIKAISIESLSTTSCTIDDLLQLLSWNNDNDTVLEGLKKAQKVKCLKAFFQPYSSEYGKDVWENCASVICERSDDELEYYIDDMLRWLQDINWPGAKKIIHRLIKMENVLLLASVLDSLVPALNYIGDDQWLMNMVTLLENPILQRCIKENTVSILRAFNDD